MIEKDKFVPSNIFDLLFYLDLLHVRYFIERCSDNGITVFIASPGKRMEIECFSNGKFEIALFTGEELTDMSITEALDDISKDM